MSTTPVHCQVCGRAIRAASGLIAHHGYTRPGDGWQTRSCHGARHVPYEEGHDALDSWIRDLTRSIPEKRAALEALQASPPAEFDVRDRDAYGRHRTPTPRMVRRPADFDSRREDYQSYMPRAYSHHFWRAVRAQRRTIRSMEEALQYAAGRRGAWTAPAEPAAEPAAPSATSGRRSPAAPEERRARRAACRARRRATREAGAHAGV